MTGNSSPRICPECGLGLPPGQEGGLCPGCSLRLALDPGVERVASITPPPPGRASRYFGDYEILGEIARGGMGLIYRARQLSLNRMVALKVIQSHHLLSDEARLRFRVEIEAVAQLHHPHIVALYESGEHEGIHFFTMRLVEGGDLSADLQRPRPLRERIEQLVKVCRAVHYAHQRGILHRDLKPSNILIDLTGEPQVVDFGLAKSVDQASGFTFTSSVLGSPSYMAPEQAAGGSRQCTTAVDIYGLGALLYHLLTGRPPFAAATPIATLRQVVEEPPIAPRLVEYGVDPDLETIALKCLRKEPAERYGTAEDLARDLERWLAGRPIVARPLGPLATAWRWVRRHPLVALLGLALSLAVAGIVVGTGVAAVRIRTAEGRANRHLGNALLSEVRAQRIRGEVGRRSAGLDLLREAVGLDDSAEFRRRARGELLALLSDTDLVFVPALPDLALTDPARSALDPGFERLFLVEGETNLVIRSVADGAVLRQIAFANGPVVRWGRFSPDGRYLVVETRDQTRLCEVATGRLCWTLARTNAVFAFDGDGSGLVYQESPNEAVFLSLPSGRLTRRWQAPGVRPGGRRSGWHTLVMSPDGRTIAGASGISRIVEWLDAEDGRAFRWLTNKVRVSGMSWSRDGGHFTVVMGDGRASVWGTTGDEPEWVGPDLPYPTEAAALHPQGQWLAVVGEDERLRLVDRASARVVFETPAQARPMTLEYQAQGKRLGPICVGQRWGWLETRPGEEYTQFETGLPPHRLWQCRFHPNGRLLAVGSPVNVVLGDAVNGRVVHALPTWRMATMVFHPHELFALTANTPGLLRFAPRETPAEMFSAKNLTVVDRARRWRALDFSPDGRWLAAYNGQSNAVFVFDATLTNRVAAMGPHTEAEQVAISPDGRWVATASYEDGRVRIWDVQRQEEVLSRRVGPRAQAAFSGDGQWVALFGESFSLLETGSWNAAPELPFPDGRPAWGAAAFSPDGQTLAVVANLEVIHLFDLRHFAFVESLRPADPLAFRALAFSPDGAQFAAVSADGRVAVWHLDKVRQRLREFGLGEGGFDRGDGGP